jgi:hypothetical protein
MPLPWIVSRDHEFLAYCETHADDSVSLKSVR